MDPLTETLSLPCPKAKPECLELWDGHDPLARAHMLVRAPRSPLHLLPAFIRAQALPDESRGAAYIMAGPREVGVAPFPFGDCGYWKLELN